MPKSKQKYLFVGLGTMGFPMAGHLSRNQGIEVYVFNRTKAVSSKWIKQHTGNQITSFDSLSIKFDGVITCLKDDAAISSFLLKSEVVNSIKTNGFILDHSTT